MGQENASKGMERHGDSLNIQTPFYRHKDKVFFTRGVFAAICTIFRCGHLIRSDRSERNNEIRASDSMFSVLRAPLLEAKSDSENQWRLCRGDCYGRPVVRFPSGDSVRLRMGLLSIV